ncbi:MAG TPA: ice-binding family protein [Candidatus Limnocylindrales bacterium]
MTLSIFKRRSGARRFRSRATWGTALLALLVLGVLVGLVGGASAAATAVPLGTANSFAVLAGSGITNTGPTTVTGDLGTFPTTSMTGIASITVNGANHAGDAVTQGAKTDLVTAYNTAAGEGPTSPIAADLGGRTLVPGVYNSASSVGLTGTLTLNAGGNPNAVFVFQAGSSLTTATGSRVNMINGAQSCNVFWQVGSSATLGTGSTFRGTIIALTSITVTTGVTVDGRVLARNGAVTLDTDKIARSTCAGSSSTTATTGTTTTGTTTQSTAAKKAAAKKAAAKKAAAKKAAASRSHARPARKRAAFTG